MIKIVHYCDTGHHYNLYRLMCQGAPDFEAISPLRNLTKSTINVFLEDSTKATVDIYLQIFQLSHSASMWRGLRGRMKDLVCVIWRRVTCAQVPTDPLDPSLLVFRADATARRRVHLFAKKPLALVRRPMEVGLSISVHITVVEATVVSLLIVLLLHHGFPL